MDPKSVCPDCLPETDRRTFFRTSAALAASAGLPLFAVPRSVEAAPTKTSAAETAVKALYDSLNDKQKEKVCFDWDHQDPQRGLLRTFVANNWQITQPTVTGGDFFTKKQQGIVHDIFKGLINPAWYDNFMKQLKDDSGGKPWGTYQSIAIFGEPGSDKFEFVITGRHQTLRADGNTQDHVAFGGPIFYGHAADSFNESKDHVGNVFWPQALAANKVYQMLNTEQQMEALVEKSPREQAVGFKGDKVVKVPGLKVSEMDKEQKTELKTVLEKLIEPFRTEDQDEVRACLKAQGGLDQCVLSFFEDSDIGKDKVWDNWRLEGPSFVWYFRGKPHVHVWVNVANDPSVKTNS